MAIFGSSRNPAPDALLDRAIRSLNAAAAVETRLRLTPAARAAIVEAAMRPVPVQPAHKGWILAGFGVVFTVTAALLVLGNGELNRPLTVQAAKAGDEVVFTISNGHRAHRVSKSTDLERAGGGKVAVEGGRFRDLAESGPVLVFYRID